MNRDERTVVWVVVWIPWRVIAILEDGEEGVIAANEGGVGHGFIYLLPLIYPIGVVRAASEIIEAAPSEVLCKSKRS